ncbi:MAG: T9SS type A sorting domain-containing protein [Saprospiraceae bacterium]|nr:T9SS type A sorting domain-containing protein [Saprospiraceae bacterium]
MKLILRFLILLSVFGFTQRSFAFTAEDLITKENLQETNCQLSALEIEIEYCTDSLVFLNASFLAENVNPSVLYYMYLNDESYGPNQYSDTNNEQAFEFAIEDPQFGSLYILEIIDGNDETCSTAVEFVLEPCANDCSINALEYEIVDCNPLDSSFYVNVWFDYDNLDSLSVSIFGSGYDWGEFDAWEQPVTLGPYYGDQGVYEVIIQDTYDSECSDVLAVDSPSCLYTDCGIDWIQYEVVDCNPLDTSFYLNIWFDNNSLDSSMVSIFGGGYDWGEFDASEQPVQLGPFIGIEDAYEVIIQNTNNSACFNVLELDTPSCLLTVCQLNITNYNIIDCNETDSTFYLELYFNYENLGGDAVSVFGGGYDWGIFNPDIQPIVVGPYFSGQTNYEVIVADQLNPNCSSAIDFGPVACSEDCSINIMEYNIIDCSETDSTFYVEVLFEYENLLGDAVSIFGGGYNWGIFNPALQPMLIGPFFTGDLVYEILVADQLDLECYDVVEFEFTGCGEDCDLIEEIWVADGPDCQGDLCEIEIGVDLSQAGANESVDIHLNGFSYFDYPPSQLDGVYFDFEQDSLIESFLIVCISGSFDCCDTLYFDFPSNGSEFVWPGDANSDNIANNIDLLYIGLADGFQGLERPNFGINWEAYDSDDWPFNFPESLINFKHADSNGDAVVDSEDIGAIIENYGLTHGVYEPDSVQGGIGDPPLFIDLPSFVEPGETVEADIDLGVISNPVQDLYGIAFTLVFPENVFLNNNIEFDFTDSWIGAIDQDLYSLQQPIEGVFEIDIALVRNDQENADANYGRIGNFIGVIDDVLGVEQVNVKIKDVHAISNNEILIPLNLPVDTMLISSTDQLLEDVRINVYPIPTDKFLYLDTDIAEEVISMEILNFSGVQVKHYDKFESRLDLKSLLNGIYLLRVKTSKGIYQERIMIFN